MLIKYVFIIFFVWFLFTWGIWIPDDERIAFISVCHVINQPDGMGFRLLKGLLKVVQGWRHQSQLGYRKVTSVDLYWCVEAIT